MACPDQPAPPSSFSSAPSAGSTSGGPHLHIRRPLLPTIAASPPHLPTFSSRSGFVCIRPNLPPPRLMRRSHCSGTASDQAPSAGSTSNPHSGRTAARNPSSPTHGHDHGEPSRGLGLVRRQMRGRRILAECLHLKRRAFADNKVDTIVNRAAWTSFDTVEEAWKWTKPYFVGAFCAKMTDTPRVRMQTICRRGHSQNSGCFFWHIDPGRVRYFLHSSRIRAKLLGDPTYLQPLMSPRSSEHVADLLEAGDEEVQGIVLAGVTPNARLFMKTEEGAKEFVALVSRPELQLGDLENILNVVLGELEQFDDQY